MYFSKCFVCGREVPSACVSRHHLIPGYIIKYWERYKGAGGVIELCANCHAIVHKIFLEPIFDVLRRELGEPESERWKKIREFVNSLE